MSIVDVAMTLGKPISKDKVEGRLLWHYGEDFDVVFVDGRLYKVTPR